MSQTTINDRESFIDASNRVVDLRLAIDNYNTELQNRIQQVREDFAAETDISLKDLERELANEERALKKYALDHESDLVDAGSRRLTTERAQMDWATNPPKIIPFDGLKDDDCIEPVRQVASDDGNKRIRDVIRVKESLNKKALAAWSDEDLERASLRRVIGTSFGLKVLT